MQNKMNSQETLKPNKVNNYFLKFFSCQCVTDLHERKITKAVTADLLT